VTVRRKLTWKGQAAISRVRAASSRGVEKVGRMLIQEYIRLIFDTPKTGRVYAGHKASAPGEAPASETGRLVNSFKLNIKPDLKTARAIVSNTADHARKLEFGTKRMLPRPFMRRGLANIKDEALKKYGIELRIALK